MISRREFSFMGLTALGATALGGGLFWSRNGFAQGAPVAGKHFPVEKTDAEWRAQLTRQQYEILRQQGTEYPGSSPLEYETREGLFSCAGCDQKLYSSSTKYDSGTGWPSFWQPLPNAVETSADNSLGMERNEVHCINCGGHLGHVFDDGPKPTGLRYCMDGFAMKFTPMPQPKVTG